MRLRYSLATSESCRFRPRAETLLIYLTSSGRKASGMPGIRLSFHGNRIVAPPFFNVSSAPRRVNACWRRSKETRRDAVDRPASVHCHRRWRLRCRSRRQGHRRGARTRRREAAFACVRGVRLAFQKVGHNPVGEFLRTGGGSVEMNFRRLRRVVGGIEAVKFLIRPARALA